MQRLPAQPEDAQILADLRAVAMKPSLEAIGRYDEQRVRARFLDTFVPTDTTKLIIDQQLIGFYVIRKQTAHWVLDHLYLIQDKQGQHIGGTLMQEWLAAADQEGVLVRVGALRNSPANRFYQKHGFVLTHETSLDCYYERQPASSLRFALLADHPAAVTIVARWYYDEWIKGRPGTTLAQVEAKLALSNHRNTAPLLLLTFLADTLAGAAELKIREMDIFPDYEHWIGGVYVDSAYRGSGIARQMVENLKARARTMGIRQLYLQTEDPNGGLYAHCGFKPLQSVEYRGHQVLVMQCELT